MVGAANCLQRRAAGVGRGCSSIFALCEQMCPLSSEGPRVVTAESSPAGSIPEGDLNGGGRGIWSWSQGSLSPVTLPLCALCLTCVFPARPWRHRRQNRCCPGGDVPLTQRAAGKLCPELLSAVLLCGTWDSCLECSPVCLSSQARPSSEMVSPRT